jgi:hypothetical protein
LPVFAESEQDEWVFEFVSADGVAAIFVERIKIFGEFVDHLVGEGDSVVLSVLSQPLFHFMALVYELGCGVILLVL